MDTKTKLLVHFCPYCGAHADEINRVDGPSEQFVVACCLSCNEEFSVDRNMEMEEEEETEEN